jgi:hypothetical protein
MRDDFFAAIDAMDADRCAAYLAPDCSVRFGKLPAVEGRPAVRDLVAGFFGALGGIRHELAERVGAPGRIAMPGLVTYTHKDGSTLSVPFANMFRIEGDLVREYLIAFIDNNALFA